MIYLYIVNKYIIKLQSSYFEIVLNSDVIFLFIQIRIGTKQMSHYALSSLRSWQ
jgi:hypothetical protein